MSQVKGTCLSWLMELVVLVAMFPGGVRYGECRARPSYRKIVTSVS